MSVQAMSWVIEKSQHKGSAFVVLLMIANHAHADGTGAWAGFETLARESRITVRQVTNIIPVLERSGELFVERGKGPRGTNLYTIRMTQLRLGMEKISNGKMRYTDFQRTVFNPNPETAQSQNLRRPEAPPSSPSCGKVKNQTPQKKRFAEVGRLAAAAMEIRQAHPEFSDGDLVEALKTWAARHDITYFDAWPGAATPIEQAITIANERRRSA